MENAVDLLVIGAGMAGLTAAARATERGARVAVVEKGRELGGSARFAGYAWTAPTRQIMAEINPHGEESLRNAVVDDFAAGLDWIRGRGVECADGVPVLRYGIGHAFDTNQYLDACAREIKAAGNTIHTGAEVLGLVTEAGAVVGATVRFDDGEVRELRARNVLLATGGFQASAELVERHLHPLASQFPLRSNPNSDGGGLALAESVDAAIGFEDAGFYGHLIPSGMGFRDSGDFVGISLYYSEHALLFNLEGERFVDETQGDHLTAMALMEQPEARGLLVADERVYRDYICGSYVEGAVAIDKYTEASKRGGRCGLAETLEEFEYLPEEWGYDGAKIADEIRRINAAGQKVVPPREYDFTPLDRGPYYIIETSPAVTFPFVGIRIGEDTSVLRADGTAIPGLLAAGSDTGGVYRRAYAGGLAPALVFGLRAGDAATPH
ncbi:FAD-dependent oxidoreductase [Rhodococcus sp. IEGM 1408]|uniref:FAD-dependent oxidoreductase n=1 Tax=Rhodococcus sp. IEGM 1408 TaxID=3082220 RepID=UPI002953CDBA|nr:FAD-dependent oxidoreductase [Rhodococcus sp. IEGM 1408]MDV8002646.1 FAD-dependent oxidoreductase [Rhodococcus sp. IEGM 1408]